jgi:3-deoxy-manno-octulosonate cytidylyltransferase (CMP-KDO synthetase)
VARSPVALRALEEQPRVFVSMAKIVAVIPARHGSTRLPAKALATIAGKPLVRRVAEGTLATGLFDEVFVATDDFRIVEAVEGSGARAVMTREDHASGTDRVAEVAATLDADLVVNVQCDLPFVDRAFVEPAIAPLLADAAIAMGTVAVPIRERARWLDPNVVKVVVDGRGRALYFSRAPIPACRDERDGAEPYGWQHVGTYVYRREFLLRFTSWLPTPLERLERLEQLRALEHGVEVAVARVEASVLEVDTDRDLEEARRIAGGRPE